MPTNLKKGWVSRAMGFTLSELLVVIIVIAVLGAIAVPVYTKAIKRSRASDALKVLSLASAKQEAYLLSHDVYASNFTDLAAPVKGLTGTGSVELGHFTYTMDKNCIIAARIADNYAIVKNVDTQEEGCIGAGCEYIQGLVPSSGSVGCEISVGEGDGVGAVDPCIANPGLCETPGGVTCPAGKIWSPLLNACVCAIGSCGANGVLNPNTCTCSCSGSCEGGKAMTDTCSCECPSNKPYFYNNQCSVCPNGEAKPDGSCCADNQCYSGGNCINKLVPEGATTEVITCGQTGTQTRTFNEGCPGSWGVWSECQCPLGQVLRNGECAACPEQAACPVGIWDAAACECGCPAPLVKVGSDDNWTCQCPNTMNESACAAEGKLFHAASCSCKECPAQVAMEYGALPGGGAWGYSPLPYLNQVNLRSYDGVTCKASCKVGGAWKAWEDMTSAERSGKMDPTAGLRTSGGECMPSTTLAVSGHSCGGGRAPNGARCLYYGPVGGRCYGWRTKSINEECVDTGSWSSECYAYHSCGNPCPPGWGGGVFVDLGCPEGPPAEHQGIK